MKESLIRPTLSLSSMVASTTWYERIKLRSLSSPLGESNLAENLSTWTKIQDLHILN